MANVATPTGNEQRRKANLRLALILASLAAVFLAGFVTKIWWMGP